MFLHDRGYSSIDIKSLPIWLCAELLFELIFFSFRFFRFLLFVGMHFISLIGNNLCFFSLFQNNLCYIKLIVNHFWELKKIWIWEGLSSIVLINFECSGRYLKFILLINTWGFLVILMGTFEFFLQYNVVSG